MKSELQTTLHVRAKNFRKHSTDAESKLWYFLRSRHSDGYKFRRQVVIGRFVVDFVCVRKKLIIELDGGQHAMRVNYDKQRTEFLQSEGYRVIRFWNNDVIADVDAVLMVIYDKLHEI